MKIVLIIISIFHYLTTALPLGIITKSTLSDYDQRETAYIKLHDDLSFVGFIQNQAFIIRNGSTDSFFYSVFSNKWDEFDSCRYFEVYSPLNYGVLCNKERMDIFNSTGSLISSLNSSSLSKDPIVFALQFKPHFLLRIIVTLYNHQMDIITLSGTNTSIPYVLDDADFPRCHYRSSQEIFLCLYYDLAFKRIIAFFVDEKLQRKHLVSQVFKGEIETLETLIDDMRCYMLIMAKKNEVIAKAFNIDNIEINTGDNNISISSNALIVKGSLLKVSSMTLLVVLELQTEIWFQLLNNNLKKHGSLIRYYIRNKIFNDSKGVYNPLTSTYFEVITLGADYQYKLVSLFFTFPSCKDITLTMDLNHMEEITLVNPEAIVVFLTRPCVTQYDCIESTVVEKDHPYTMPLKLLFDKVGQFQFSFHTIHSMKTMTEKGNEDIELYSFICNFTVNVIANCQKGEVLNLLKSKCVNETELQSEMNDIMTNIDENILFLSHYVTVGNSKFQIYNTTKQGIKEANENEKNNGLLSKLELGIECEDKLSSYYDIMYPRDFYYIVFKKDTYEEDRFSYDIDYAVFLLNGTRIDMSLCKDTRILMIIPIIPTTQSTYDRILELKKMNISAYDPKDPFFTDVCFNYTKNGSDVPRQDRINEELINEEMLCPPGCSYLVIDKVMNSINCSCIPSNTRPPSKDFQLVKKNLLDSLSYGNWEILGCSDKLYESNALLSNIGNWFMITIDGLLVIAIGCFVKYKQNHIRDYMKNVYNETVKKEKAVKNYNKKKEKDETINQSFQLLYLNETKNKIPNKVLKHLSSGILTAQPKMNDSTNPTIQLPMKKGSSSKTIIVFPNYEKVPKKNYEHYKQMSYDEFKVSIERPFHRIYWNFLQYIHPICYTFIYPSRYNLRTITFILFFLNIILSFGLSALFFEEQYISNNYHNEGTEEFTHNLPVVIYATIVSSLLHFLLKTLSNPERSIENFLRVKTADAQHRKLMQVLYCHQLRLWLFFPLVGFFGGFLWYVSTVFCAVYQMSQWNWMICGAMSCMLNMIVLPIISSLCYSFLVMGSYKFQIKIIYVFVQIMG